MHRQKLSWETANFLHYILSVISKNTLNIQISLNPFSFGQNVVAIHLNCFFSQAQNDLNTVA